MDSSTQPSTRSSRHPPLVEEEKGFANESSDSEHSFDHLRKRERKKHLYLTTSLVVDRNITLADVVSEEVSHKEVMERISGLARHCRFRANPYGRIDPRGLLKLKQREGGVETMVPHEEIGELTEATVRVVARFREKNKGSRSVSPLDGKDVLRKLQQRIAHDHSIRDPARTAG